jgi:serine-type D-Ala-D-Ala carboxypeptidase (penicillin-binding protein 5/6)
LAFDPKDSDLRPPAASARTWLLADLDSGEVLAARGAHVQRPPASTLKTLTALALMPRLSLDAARIAEDADVRVDGGTTGMVVGGMYSVRDLWHGLLLDSGNDTAVALARTLSPDVADTIRLMQQEAERLQALDTVVRNPHGLDAQGQVSSVYDMALFARAAMSIPYFRDVTMARSYQFPMPGGEFQIQNENRLMRSYSGVLGGKSGYTSKAGSTYWGAVEQDGRRLIVVMFGISGRIDRAAGDLLEWGFRHADDLNAVGVLVEPQSPNQTVPVPLAQTQQDAPSTEPDDDAGTAIRWSLMGFAVLAAALGLAISRAERRDRAANDRRDPVRTG